jgi:hypothetical protein
MRIADYWFVRRSSPRTTPSGPSVLTVQVDAVIVIVSVVRESGRAVEPPNSDGVAEASSCPGQSYNLAS